MRKFACRSVGLWAVCLASTLYVPAVAEDLVLEAAQKVSVGQYRAYQVDIENMGLGLYGGPDYDQQYRNRDGWLGGGTVGNEEARLYLTEQLSSMGLYVYTQGLYRNVVAELRGIHTPQNIYIVCGHFDTTCVQECPGGDDNASGTAGVLEAARVLTQYQFDSTLRFIGFNAEEDWMLGSQEYVDEVVLAKNEKVMGVLNLDMILRPAWDSDPSALLDLDIETGKSPACFALNDLFVEAAAAYAPTLVIDPNGPHTRYWDAGDQGPFIAAGIPALMIIENTAIEIWSKDSNVYYHDAQDVSDGLANDPHSPSGVTYDYEFATDVVRTTVATLAMQAGIGPKPIPEFREVQTIPASRAQDAEFFTIAGDSYLMIGNGSDEPTLATDSVLYKWDGSQFVQHQVLPTNGVTAWRFFSNETDSWLVTADRYEQAPYSVDVRVYGWDGVGFVAGQAIPIAGPTDCEFFTIDGHVYLAIASTPSDVMPNANSQIFRWDGAQFTAFQVLPTSGAGDCEFFSIGGAAYMAIANGCDGRTHEVYSKIYRWNGSQFEDVQAIATLGAADCEFFAVDGGSYLAIANTGDDSTCHVDSRIYKWDGSQFVAFQFLPTVGASDCEFFTHDGDSWLAVANTSDGSTDEADSKIYRWNGKRFVEFTSIPTCGAKDWTSFTIGDRCYLAVAGAESTIYQYHEPLTANPDSGDGTPIIPVRRDIRP